MLKNFLTNKKTACILQLHQEQFVTDFEEKANIFNNSFADQCSIVRNNSELTATLTKTTATEKQKTPESNNNKKSKTGESLPKINFSTDDILKIIRNLHPNESPHTIISIQMINTLQTSKNNLSVLFRKSEVSR